tara:strand:+ start:25 stop:1242 length:1218 start_codon:yes stop_codon:yes gene_type:complete
MPNRGKFIGNDNLYVPDAPTIGDASAGNTEVSVAFTAPSDVGNDAITAYGVSVTDGTNVIGATGSSSPVTVTGLTNGTSYTAQVWAINDYGNGPLSAATSSFSPAAPKGIMYGGKGELNIIESILFESAGNTIDFGDLTNGCNNGAGGSSNVKGILGYGSISGTEHSDTIEKLNISSTGNSQDFGNLTVGRSNIAAASNDTRCLFAGGGAVSGGGTGGNANLQRQNVVDFVTIASDGNATDFGNLTISRNGIANGTSASATRAIFAGGDEDGPVNRIDYRDIASTGNFSDFGDLTVARASGAAVASATRMCMAGGRDGNVIDFITIASTGNASDFGDRTFTGNTPTGTSSKTIGLICGGQGNATVSKTIDKIVIASASNATDFGDTTQGRNQMSSGISNAHGGLA